MNVLDTFMYELIVLTLTLVKAISNKFAFQHYKPDYKQNQAKLIWTTVQYSILI